MATTLLSFDEMERVLGRMDGQEESDNRGDLTAAKRVLRLAMEQELTQRQRECVELYYFQGLTEEQTAQRLSVSKPTVCRHLQKSRKRLEKAVRYAMIRK